MGLITLVDAEMHWYSPKVLPVHSKFSPEISKFLERKNESLRLIWYCTSNLIKTSPTLYSWKRDFCTQLSSIGLALFWLRGKSAGTLPFTTNRVRFRSCKFSLQPTLAANELDFPSGEWNVYPKVISPLRETNCYPIMIQCKSGWNIVSLENSGVNHNKLRVDSLFVEKDHFTECSHGC